MTSILILGSTGFIGKNLKNLFEEHDDLKFMHQIDQNLTY